MTNFLLVLIVAMLFVGLCELGDIKIILRNDDKKVEDTYQSEKSATHDAQDQPDGAAPSVEDFAVTGKPLKPSWRVRKRELEAASRTKRKHLESFQEHV